MTTHTSLHTTTTGVHYACNVIDVELTTHRVTTQCDQTHNAFLFAMYAASTDGVTNGAKDGVTAHSSRLHLTTQHVRTGDVGKNTRCLNGTYRNNGPYTQHHLTTSMAQAGLNTAHNTIYLHHHRLVSLSPFPSDRRSELPMSTSTMWTVKRQA